MPESIAWRLEDRSLILSGELTAKTLLPLWQQKHELLKTATSLNTAGLSHVDSAGLALIVQFIGDGAAKGQHLGVSGVTDKLNTLIALYNLKEIIQHNLLP